MLPKLDDVLGDKHQLYPEGGDQGSLLSPGEGEQVAVMEVKLQKVVLGYMLQQTNIQFTDETTKPHHC